MALVASEEYVTSICHSYTWYDNIEQQVGSFTPYHSKATTKAHYETAFSVTAERH